ncbi:MAG TPA: glycoside hydrolase domain-containing protein [Bryobacteraceae bacterium]|nr:glycoside hydrolase domain-containing protein [Bryobacteraceae bacterium]
MQKSKLLTAIPLLVVLVGAGCGGSSSLRTWHVDSLVKVFPDDKPGTNELSDKTWLVARNGHVNVQVALRSEKAIPQLRVELKAPENDGKKLEAEARWVEYVPIGSNPPGTPFDELVRPAPGLFPDPLMETWPFALKAAITQPVWVTVHAPADAQPGEYKGEVTFFAGQERLKSVDFTVRVTAAAVPAEQKLKVTNWFNFSYDPATPDLRLHYKIDPYSDKHWELLGNLGRVMAAHKQNVILTPVMALAKPSVAGGAIRYDFSLFDKWVETFQKAGLVGTIEGGHLLGRSGGFFTPMVVPAYVIEGGRIVQKGLDTDDPRAEQFLGSFLTALYAHLKEKGWEKQYIQHVHDEPHDREAAIYNRYSKIIHKYLPGVPTIDAVGLDQDISFFADVCDIWVPVLSSFDHQLDKMRAHVEKGGQAWFYTCIGPQGRYLNRFTDLPLVKTQLLHWFNFRYDLTGFLHWGGSSWGPKPFQNVQTVINDNRTLLPAGDNAIVYPNAEKLSVLSSIRLEAMREGIEDYELLVALAGKDQAKAKGLAKTAIPNINDYVRDVPAFRKLQRQLLEAF